MAGPPGRMMAGRGPDQRSLDFKKSTRRLLGHFRPERATIILLLACVVVSVTLEPPAVIEEVGSVGTLYTVKARLPVRVSSGSTKNV